MFLDVRSWLQNICHRKIYIKKCHIFHFDVVFAVNRERAMNSKKQMIFIPIKLLYQI